MHARVLQNVAKVFRRDLRRAWNRLHDRGVKAERVHRLMLTVFTATLRKGLKSWTSNSAYLNGAFKALAYWRNAGLRRAFLKLAAGLDKLYAARRAGWQFMSQGRLKGLNRWFVFLERRAAMLASRMAMVHAATKRALNTWAAEADRRKKQNAPLKRAMAHWQNQPLSRALHALRKHAAVRRKLRAQLRRWVHGKLSAALNSWVARTSKRGSVTKRAVMGVINRPQRLALNSWLAYAAGRRRLRGLMHTFRNPAKKRGFTQWRSVTRSRPKMPKSPPKSPHQWRMIKAMTWRECCSWLTRVGIPVSRSPPTLIRTLKEGFVYQELVRKISPAYYVRHKVAQCHETNGVFLMVQQFLDTELVISFIGCQKLDVLALEAGKAIDHLQLVMLFKTILVGVSEREGVHK